MVLFLRARLRLSNSWLRSSIEIGYFELVLRGSAVHNLPGCFGCTAPFCVDVEKVAVERRHVVQDAGDRLHSNIGNSIG